MMKKQDRILFKEIEYSIYQERIRLDNKITCQKHFIYGFVKEEETYNDLLMYYKDFNVNVLKIMSIKINNSEKCSFKIGESYINGNITKQDGYVKVIIERFDLEMRDYDSMKKIMRCGIFLIDDCKFFVNNINSFISKIPQSNNIVFDVLNKKTTQIQTQIRTRVKPNQIDELNSSQDDAVMKALEQKISFIIGPPGTGKTITLATLAAILIISGYRVLLTATSNKAVDQLLLATIERSGNFKAVRLGCFMDQRCKRFSRQEFIKNNNDNYWNNHVINSNLVAANMFSLSMKFNWGIGDFDYVIADEVSMTNVPSLMVATYYSKNAVVFAGDSMQLPPPIPFNPNDPERWYCDSIFEKSDVSYCDDPRSTLLNTQNRMQGEIGELVSQLFYKSLLMNGTVAIPRNENFPSRIVFFNTAGCVSNLGGAMNYGEEQTRCNENHAKIILDTVLFSLNKGFKEPEIGVICPYNAQVDLVRRYLQRDGINEVQVSTVHSFQGQERKQIIVDFTDDDIKPTQLTADQRLINVAISRAKEQLILVGNKGYLSNEQFFTQDKIKTFAKMLGFSIVVLGSFFQKNSG